jgi:radical SAM protein (TIGR04043 family)
MKTLDFPTALLSKKQWLLSELQSSGLRIEAADSTVPSRTGGAGPTDHKAVTLLGTTIMVPIHTLGAAVSPFSAGAVDDRGQAVLYRNEEPIGVIQYPPAPKFYGLSTEEGIPYWKIAQLHSSRVLATTLLQTCIRYGNPSTKCQFCAIGESLKAGRTIREKSPAQLAEVALAAKLLDGIDNVVMTTGTPPTPDRGAAVLAAAAAAIKLATRLPIQAQCEPPDDFLWFVKLRAAGVDSLGMHLEAWDEGVRRKIMPGKAEVPLSYYMEAFSSAVKVFGRGQVSTYLLAGLGDTPEGLIDAARKLISLGVYPFIVPFVPVTGTPLAGHAPPSADFMKAVLAPVGQMLSEAGMTSETVKAGCAKCGACSSLSSFEKPSTSACSAA